MPRTTATSAVAEPPPPVGGDFDFFAAAVRARFAGLSASLGPVFHTNAEGLYEAYLGGFPTSEERQHHTCSCCSGFIRHYGDLAFVDASGELIPAFWNPEDFSAGYAASARAMARIVKRARIVSPFKHGKALIGTPEAGGWTHFSARLGVEHIHTKLTSLAKSAGQVMAAKREDFQTLVRALGEFKPDVVDQAVRILEADALYRGEKVLAPAKFLQAVHASRSIWKGKGPAAENVTWLAIATAPPGWCAPRSGMVGTLLEDIAAGLPIEDVKRRFGAKMHPLQYQRPQAPPSAGNIKAAEKLVEQLGLAPSLRRRWARFEEVQTIWTPAVPKAPASAGVFGHLKPKGASEPLRTELPSTAMTWVKFAEKVLPSAESMTVDLGRFTNQAFVGFVTAADPDAPPILQWDAQELRNPVSWYLYHGGSAPRSWGLDWRAAVTGVCLNPALWNGRTDSRYDAQAVLLLEGCKDTRDPSLCIFPETLKSDLHGVRSTIEAFSRAGVMEGREDASAAGLLVGKQGLVGASIQVATALGTAHYQIDRWD